MSNLGKLQGIIWHEEKLKLRDGEAKRHKTWCQYYAQKEAHSCTYTFGKCIGSAHCDHYKKKEQILEEKNEFIKVKPFDDIRSIPIKDLILAPNLQTAEVRKKGIKKINTIIEFYKEHGVMDKPIIVCCEGDKYMLIDKYARYLAAVELELETIPAEMGNKEDLHQRNMLRKKGTLVWNNCCKDVGEVIKFDCKKVRIRYDSGKEEDFDIVTGLKTGTIRVM